MRIILTSSEAVPLSKTGGLADVVTGLGKALVGLGHEVTLITPHYPGSASGSGCEIEPTGVRITADVGGDPIGADVLRTRIDDTLDVLLVDNRGLFDRPTLYGDASGPYQDNCRRFCFFSRAVLEIAGAMDLRPEVIHANDWQTALLAPLVQIEQRQSGRQPGLGVVLTIHNMAFQGQFWQWDMRLTGLDWSHFNWTELEYYGDLNLLKGGIVFADQVNTVSPTYAREIQTPEYGAGLDGVLRTRADDLCGILNGVDLSVWSPETDPHLPANYGASGQPRSVAEGKEWNKGELRSRFGLPQSPSPLVGMICRMTQQKGFDLIRAASDRLLATGCQFVFLGTGDAELQGWCAQWAAENESVAAEIGFSEPLAHQIEAAADLFLMPSRFEPCGLNQMYSQIYGTLPIVTPVGGLADSVVDTTDETFEAGEANGFVLPQINADGLVDAVQRAAEAYREPARFNRLREHAMACDWSWTASAKKYVEMYDRALNDARQR